MSSIEQSEEAMPQSQPEDWSALTRDRIATLLEQSPEPAVGYLVWIKGHYTPLDIERLCTQLRARGIRHIRTGVGWAEWYDQEHRERIVGYMRELSKHFRVLACFTFTPPELGIKPSVNSPPKNTDAYSAFVAEALQQLGEYIEAVELWNEWNLNTDWDPELDPKFDIFQRMIVPAAHRVHDAGKRAVLGGASKVNEVVLRYLAQFADAGMRDTVDVVGFHNLRGTWSDSVPSAPLGQQASWIKNAWGRAVPVWLTEYGFPVADPEGRFDIASFENIQVALFAYGVYCCLTGGIERMYWYTLRDEVHESLRFATTGWEDVLQYYYGDTDERGHQRLLGRLLCEGGPAHVLHYAVQENLMPLVDKASLGRDLQAYIQQHDQKNAA